LLRDRRSGAQRQRQRAGERGHGQGRGRICGKIRHGAGIRGFGAKLDQHFRERRATPAQARFTRLFPRVPRLTFPRGASIVFSPIIQPVYFYKNLFQMVVK
jgi:hypothetical protein